MRPFQRARDLSTRHVCLVSPIMRALFVQCRQPFRHDRRRVSETTPSSGRTLASVARLCVLNRFIGDFATRDDAVNCRRHEPGLRESGHGGVACLPSAGVRGSGKVVGMDIFGVPLADVVAGFT